jgi:hypothetical protein
MAVLLLLHLHDVRWPLAARLLVPERAVPERGVGGRQSAVAHRSKSGDRCFTMATRCAFFRRLHPTNGTGVGTWSRRAATSSAHHRSDAVGHHRGGAPLQPSCWHTAINTEIMLDAILSVPGNWVPS